MRRKKVSTGRKKGPGEATIDATRCQEVDYWKHALSLELYTYNTFGRLRHSSDSLRELFPPEAIPTSSGYDPYPHQTPTNTLVVRRLGDVYF